MFHIEKLNLCRFELDNFYFLLDSSTDFMTEFLENAISSLVNSLNFTMKLENINETCHLTADNKKTTITQKNRILEFAIPKHKLIYHGYQDILHHKQSFLHFQSCCSLDRKTIQLYEKKIDSLLQELSKLLV